MNLIEKIMILWASFIFITILKAAFAKAASELSDTEKIYLGKVVKNDENITTKANSTDDEDYRDPIENPDYFEGDIMLPPLSERNAVRHEERKWLNGIVPYTIPGFYGIIGRIVVALAIAEFSRTTCIKFVPRTNETDYLELKRGDGCWSYVGRLGGKQDISLASPCDRVGIVIHEFMHALGFWHEQSRTDRDEYVTIHWNNIIRGTEGNFHKYSNYVQQTLDEGYDYASLMHYSRTAFSRNSLATVEPKDPLAAFFIGQRYGFSSADIRKINKLYNC